MHPDGFQRERLFRTDGDMLQPAAARPSGTWRLLLERFANWRMKRTGRLVLRDLSDAQLDDIGLTRADALREVRKSAFLDDAG
jgi:uncharacterized protein YjiS (DUF1127 family)